MSLLEGATFLKEIVVAVAAAGTALAAARGISAWRRQLIGTAKYQLSKKVLRCVAMLKLSIQRARDPFVFGQESAERKHSAEETEPESVVLDQRYAFFKRLDRVQSARSELQLVEHEAWAVWGEEASDAIRPLYSITNELFSAYQIYFDERLAEANDRGQQRNPELREMLEVLYYHGAKDAFLAKIDRAVERAEDWFRPHLKEEESSLLGWLFIRVHSASERIRDYKG